MNKYFCKCGKEIGYLLIDWEESFSDGTTTNNAQLLCQDHAEQYMSSECFEGFRTKTSVRISVSTKKEAVKQILAQYLKGDCPGYLPKVAITEALKSVFRIK